MKKFYGVNFPMTGKQEMFEDCSFSEKNNIHFSQCNFYDCEFNHLAGATRSYFRDCRFLDVNFYNVSLVACCFDDCHFVNCYIQGDDMIKYQLSGGPRLVSENNRNYVEWIGVAEICQHFTGLLEYKSKKFRTEIGNTKLFSTLSHF